MIGKILRRTLITTIALLQATVSFACAAPANLPTSTSTPEPTATAAATATPTVSPTPTPALTPTTTPMPELTYEQKKALLGIDEDFTDHILGELKIFEISFGNVTGRIWGVMYGKLDEPLILDFHSVCNDEYLFTLNLKSSVTYVDEFPRYLGDSNENLKNLKLINSTSPTVMARHYDAIGVSYNNCHELEDIVAKYEKDPEGTVYLPISKEEIVDLIIKSTPQEKIIPFWVYTPGAQIPEELKGFYSEEEYPPAPAE